MRDKENSRFISLILRQKPEAIGIQLDEHGWANVDEIGQTLNKYIIGLSIEKTITHKLEQ